MADRETLILEVEIDIHRETSIIDHVVITYQHMSERNAGLSIKEHFCSTLRTNF